MSATSVKLEQLYGLKGDVKNNIMYVDELNVLYPCGYNIINYNIEKKTQQFISLSKNDVNNASSLRGNTGTGEISAMALTSSRTGGARTKLVAVAERASLTSKPSVTVFEVNPTNDSAFYRKRGKAPIESKDVGSHEYVSICFSPDGKYLLTQGGAPDWTLVNWQWEKSRPLQAAKVSNKLGAAIHQTSFCPTDPTVVCVSGNCILRFLHLEQNEFKSIPFTMGKRPPQNYTCHAWIDDRILVGTDTGDILVFENAEFRGVLSSSPSDGKSIDSICAFSRGFVCGCDEGVLYVFERDEKEIYKASKSFQIEGNFVRIKNIAISPSEDNVICTLENNQAYVLGLSNTDILKSEEMNFEPLSFPFHHLNITGA
jgi:WD40 repeat protein